MDTVPQPGDRRRRRAARNADRVSGRSVLQMPLLEYLAYYQVIEDFLPTHAHTLAIRRLRAVLNDPRFDRHDDAALGRVVEMLTHGGHNYAKEREQFHAVLAAYVDEAQMRSFLDDHPAAGRALADKRRSSAFGR